MSGLASTAAAALAIASAVWAAACTTTNIHDTPQAKGRACADCHQAAYDQVQTPVHVGVYPNTCGDCHSTTAWAPATAGHPEAKFPITTGSHSNKAIGCDDCHIPSLGSDANGANTDCIHCHIGAHTTPSIDGTHAGVMGYTPSAMSAPNSCLGCHSSG